MYKRVPDFHVRQPLIWQERVEYANEPLRLGHDDQSAGGSLSGRE